MTGASLWAELAFCLFSFLFGAGIACFYGFFSGVLSALRMLPSPLAEREAGKIYFWGYLVFDLLFFLVASSAYMIFLFAAHNGVFRIYSLLLLCGGAYLFRRAAMRAFARPVFFLFDRILRILFCPLRALLRKCTRKNAKKLDEAK